MGALRSALCAWAIVALSVPVSAPTQPAPVLSHAQFLSAHSPTAVATVGDSGFSALAAGGLASSKRRDDKLFGVPDGCNGDVHAMVVSPSGIVYLGGMFSACEDVAAAGVVAYDPRTLRFASLGTGTANGVDLWVNALALSGNDLYVGGYFFNAGGQAANSIARWNGSTWSALGSGAANGVNQPVNAIAIIGSDVYVAGDFPNAGGQLVNRIARWNGSAWSALGSGANVGVDCCAVALAVSGTDLIVGGSFTQAGGQPFNHIVRWNGSAWLALGTGVTGESVRALEVSGSDLIVGGRFSEAGGQSANGIARWNGSTWSTFGSGVNETVEAIEQVGNDLYVGGRFSQAGGLPANTIARWNGSAWSAVADANGNALPIGGFVFSLARHGADLYVGGSFSRAGGEATNRVARWSGTAWSALGTGAGNGLNSDVYALVADGSNLYVGGRFTEAAGASANRIARWNGSRWFTLPEGPGNGFDSVVYALANSANGLYAGGGFSNAGAVEVNHIARWDGTAWSPLGSGFPDFSAVVYAIATSGSDVYAAGDFQSAGGQPANRIARWNGASWSALGTGLGSGDDRVYAVAVSGSTVYAGGRFTIAGGQAVHGIARWNGSAWSAVGGDLGWTIAGEPVTVYALLVVGSNLYAAGSFNLADGAAANNIARWDGNAWSALSGPGFNGVDSSVFALTANGADIFAGGQFTHAGEQPAGGIARWNGSTWEGLANGGPRQVPRAMTSDATNVYAGGSGLTQTPLPELQTKAATGAPANAASSRAVVSANGAQIGFVSDASNLTPGDANGRTDVFLRDLVSGVTTRASSVAEAINGGAAEAFSDPALSADGRTLAFSGSSGQLYVAVAGVGRSLSSSAAGVLGNGVSALPFVPGVGAFVLFQSQATNLLATADGNGAVDDIYSKSLDTGAVSLISAAPNGDPANGRSTEPAASRDGQVVVFRTLATNLVSGAEPPAGVQQAVMMRGAGFGQSRLYLSRNLGNGQLGNGNSGNVRVTPDGRYGVFETLASNLVAGDTNSVSDVYRFEISNNVLSRLERISVSTYGVQANGPSKNASISDDGAFVTFETDATNLVELDRNSTTDVVVKWMASGEVLRLSRTTDGAQPNGATVQPALSGDGASIVFASSASNLAPGDNNSAQDVYSVRLRGLPPVNPSGAWFDPNQDGHGLQVELLANNRVLAFWYTFDPAGNLTYFIGDGAFDGNTATLTNLRPIGTFFPPNFSSSQVSLQPFGQMTLRFTSCSAGSVDFNLPQGFGQGSMNLTRLTQPAGVACGNTPTTTATGPMAGATGAWYNPAMDGQGLVMESLAGGLLLATWYTYGPSPTGGQAWMTGVGSISGNTATLSMLKLTGGRFIPNFNPALITRPVLGTATITFTSCSAGTVSYNFGQGFGSASMPLTRLTTPVGVVCAAN